jgi:hypothetical protein
MNTVIPANIRNNNVTNNPVKNIGHLQQHQGGQPNHQPINHMNNQNIPLTNPHSAQPVGNPQVQRGATAGQNIHNNVKPPNGQVP